MFHSSSFLSKRFTLLRVGVHYGNIGMTYLCTKENLALFHNNLPFHFTFIANNAVI